MVLGTCIGVLEASGSLNLAHMASSNNDNLPMLDKFNGDNFGLWKFKMEMVLAAKDLWVIVDKSESPHPMMRKNPLRRNTREGARRLLPSLP